MTVGVTELPAGWRPVGPRSGIMGRMSDPDGAQQRRDQLRRTAAQCWATVQAAVDAEDPEGLLKFGAPLDEYDLEVEDLVRLVRDKSVTPTRVLEF